MSHSRALGLASLAPVAGVVGGPDAGDYLDASGRTSGLRGAPGMGSETETELGRAPRRDGRRWGVWCLVLGVAATVIALPLCFVLVAIVRAIMPMLDVPLHVQLGDVVAMLVLALGVSAVAGLLPALYAARLPPRALRGHA